MARRLDFDITAKDKTKSGVRSANRGFDSLEKKSGCAFGGIKMGAGGGGAALTQMGGKGAGAAAGIAAAMKVATAAIVAVTAAVAGSIAAFKSLSQQVLNFSRLDREILFLAESIGISTEALSVWTYGAKQLGLTADDMAMSIREVSARIGEVDVAIRQGGSGGEPGEAFKELGLSIESLLKLSPDQQFRSVANALSNVDNESQKAALANAVLSDQYAEILPQLLRISDSYNENARAATASGNVVTKSQAEAATESLAAWDRFTGLFKGAFRQAIYGTGEGEDKGVLGQITDLSDTLTNDENFKVTVKAITSEAISVVTTGIAAIKELLTNAQFLATVKAVTTAASNGVKAVIKFIKELLKNPFVLTLVSTAATVLDNIALSASNLITKIGEEGIAGSLLWAFNKVASVTIYPNVSEGEERVRASLDGAAMAGIHLSGAWVAAMTLMELVTGQLAGKDGTVPRDFGILSDEAKMLAEDMNKSAVDSSNSFNWLGEQLKITYSGIADIISGAVVLWSGIMNIGTGAMAADWDLVWLGFQQVVQGAGNAIIGAVETILDTIVLTIEQIPKAIADLFGVLSRWEFTIKFPTLGFEQREFLGVGYSFPTLTFEDKSFKPFGGASAAEHYFNETIAGSLEAYRATEVPRLTFADTAQASYDLKLEEAALGINTDKISESVARFRQEQYIKSNPSFLPAVETLHRLNLASGTEEQKERARRYLDSIGAGPDSNVPYQSYLTDLYDQGITLGGGVTPPPSTPTEQTPTVNYRPTFNIEGNVLTEQELTDRLIRDINEAARLGKLSSESLRSALGIPAPAST